MSEPQPSTAYRCGQLYATLHVLRSVGTGDRALDKQEARDKVQKRPEEHLGTPLSKAAQYVMAARRKGADRGKAADELFRAIADFIPANGKLPAALGEGEKEEFATGFHQQMAEYTPVHGRLMK
ncbi:hypothetical protein ACIRP2_01545 [Streptomyces sp. NPDC101194]|uniref:hypothetical protein n=1 Tax=Streptomyces sp. NPDC101194 TaxID=3366127 RepID=UPI0037F73118